ncbi:MAG: hypothetical protein KC635_29215, partial [Myxococcales bacterium]|nr:hypothetical protein [Myxococcales bacterium]
PGPAYLWQALLQIRAHGGDLASIQVQINSLTQPFPSAAAFFQAIDPVSEPRWFNLSWALPQLRAISANGGKPLDRKASSAAPAEASSAPSAPQRAAPAPSPAAAPRDVTPDENGISVYNT